MQLDIKATGIELTDAIRAAIETKLNALDTKLKRFGDVVRASVEVGKTTAHHRSGPVFRAEIILKVPGNDIYVESVGDDLYAAIGDAKRELEREIVQRKEEFTDKRRQAK